MAKLVTLQATYRIVTPMFLGGANPTTDPPELRPPSIKGALRFWYRAIDPDYRKHEARIFGGTERDEGQAMFLLRLSKGTRPSTQAWNPDQYNACNSQNAKFNQRATLAAHSSEDTRTWRLNGVSYFSFGLKTRDYTREFIPENTQFTLILRFRKTPDSDDQRKILAALWLLGHIGGLGARSRRGFGTVALQSWVASDPSAWPELNALPIAHVAQNVDTWWTQFANARHMLKSGSWFSGTRTADHSVFGSNTRFKLFNTGRNDWAQALNDAGKAMQEFRQRHDLGNAASDYFRVKKHICHHERTRGTPGVAVGAASLTANGPDRAAFGLPLSFRYSSLAYEVQDRNGRPRRIPPPETTFQGQQQGHERSASRIHARIVKIGGNHYPLYIRLDGPLLGHGERIKDKWGDYDAPGDVVLDQFWNQLWSASGLAREMPW